MSLSIDDSEFLRGLDLLDDTVYKAAVKGMGRAGEALLADTVLEIPAVPLDEGTLRGSGSAFVQGKLKRVAENTGGNPTPATDDPEGKPEPKRKSEMPDINATVGFNTPYAARLHEGVEFEFQHSGTGAKFLEKKLAENASEYMGVAADEVRKALA